MILLLSGAMLLSGDPVMGTIGTGIWAVFTYLVYCQ